MIDRLLEHLTSLTLRHSRRILVIAALVGLGALVAASKLELNPEMLDFVPAHKREVREFRRVVGLLGSIDHHIVVVRVPEGRLADEYAPLVERLASQYRSMPDIERVEYRLPGLDALGADLLPYTFLLLGPESLDDVAGRLTDEAIREAMIRNRSLLQTPQSGVAKEILRWDPFGLYPLFLERFGSGSGGLRLDPSTGYLVSEDGTTFLVIVRPGRPAQDLPFATELMGYASDIERRVLDGFAREQPETPLPEMVYAGGYAVNVADLGLIRRDMIANVAVSFIGVLLLFLYAFRRFAALGYAAIPMGLAVLLTFATAALTVGSLSAASAGFGALLAGLGVDFITVLYERYVEERNRGLDVGEALSRTLRMTMPGVLVAAITTAATFYGFLATEFRGMTQMGFLTGTGILIFFLCVVFVLPALLVATEKSMPRAPGVLLHAAGASRLMRLSMRRPVRTIGVWSVALLLSGFAATGLRYEDDAGKLRSGGNAGVLAQELVSEKFGSGMSSLMAVSEAPTSEEALAGSDRTLPLLDQLVAEGTIGGYQSLATFVPSPSRQEMVIAALGEGRDSLFDADRIEKSLRRAVAESGFREGAWDDYMVGFRQALETRKTIDVTAMELPGISSFVDRFLHATEDGWMSVSWVYPSGISWPDGVPDELLSGIGRLPGTFVTGVPVVSRELREIARSDAWRSTILGFILVLVLLSLGFRSVGRALLVFVPFISGCIGMMGFMALIGIPFNMLNIFVGLMLVGVGTDYGIYVLQRYLEAPDSFTELAPHTGKAVVMAALTSIVGYGSFSISHYPGLRSIGYASTIGVGLSGLAAVTLLPAILVWWHGRSQRAPSLES